MLKNYFVKFRIVRGVVVVVVIDVVVDVDVVDVDVVVVDVIVVDVIVVVVDVVVILEWIRCSVPKLLCIRGVADPLKLRQSRVREVKHMKDQKYHWTWIARKVGLHVRQIVLKNVIYL